MYSLHLLHADTFGTEQKNNDWPTVAAAERSVPPRAPRPKWSQDVFDAFFVDARKHLVGTRPTKSEGRATETRKLAVSSPGPNSHSHAWSLWVDRDTLETEIKRIALSLRANLKSPSRFQSGGFQQCRRDFSILAVLFAVIHQFDQEVRWKRDAAALRDRFARSGFHCKVASEDTFAEAKERHDQLIDLLRGNQHRLEEPSKPVVGSQVADRSVLMRRMEQSLKEQISPNLGNKTVFRRQATALEHEAQLLAMLAEWTGREGYEYWDDDSYAHEARQLRDAAVELGAASREHDYGRARQAAGRIGQACNNCHEDYRE